MADRYDPRVDEHDVEFSDTRAFAVERWNDSIASMKHLLCRADFDKINRPKTWRDLVVDIRKRGADSHIMPAMKRNLNNLQPLPQTLSTFVDKFAATTAPHDADFTILWGLLDLNTELSCTSGEKLARTAAWTKKLRGHIELFNRCLGVLSDDMNEARIKMVEVLEYLVQIYGESIKYLRQPLTEPDASRGWRMLEAKINDNIADVEAAVRHLNDMTSYSKVGIDRQAYNIARRHAVNLPDEAASFPIKMISRKQNEDFYGRTEELAKINQFLDHKDPATLRTYTIYGRRGVGKTDIALQYAYTNPSNFDAIFWVQCETKLALRQSFTDMAVDLCLPGADSHGRHEENQLAVLKWLKTTKKRWLLIFDNAEKEYTLKGYWPIGCAGSILITSRSYYNFMNDAKRQGATIKTFNDTQSWKLLMRFLGPDWVKKDEQGSVKGHDESAGREFLKDLGGLALAIQQAAELIKKSILDGGTIASTYKAFRDKRDKLPERPGTERSEIIKSLDSLWSMTFSLLTRNARYLLSVLALLSPDGISIDLFLPRNQSALDGRLQFCKQHPGRDNHSTSNLSSVINAPVALSDAIEELVSSKLVTQEGRELFAHRVVQEAMIYNSQEILQECFDSASALVYEAFPKQLHGDYLSSQWPTCQTYISHGAHLSRQLADYNSGGKDVLKGSLAFVDLLSNCAWYLYEVSDYDMCLRVAETAAKACLDKRSRRFALICSVAGSAYYELNKLGECRREWELFMDIQEDLLDGDELETSLPYHCMGNLEYASDNLVEALEYYKQAVEMREAAGDRASGLLAISYLCMSRVYYLRREFPTALAMLGKSEALFVRTAGAAAPFMTHVHFAYGNVEYAQQKWAAAKRAYDIALKIALPTSAIHPITISIYYSLGCVELEKHNLDNAKNYLDKAMAIAQLRSPNRDDGTMARILWKTSKVLDAYDGSPFEDEAKDMLNRAELARTLLTNNGEGAVIALGDDGNTIDEEEEESYDRLVPGYFR